MPKPSESFGKNVKAALGERAQSWLAEQAETTPAMISDYISGKKSPKLKTAEKIADALGVPLLSLLRDEAPKAAPASLDSLRLEAIKLIAVADRDDVTAVLLTLKGESGT